MASFSEDVLDKIIARLRAATLQDATARIISIAGVRDVTAPGDATPRLVPSGRIVTAFILGDDAPEDDLSALVAAIRLQGGAS